MNTAGIHASELVARVKQLEACEAEMLDSRGRDNREAVNS